MVGVIIVSISFGGGEFSFLGLMYYYGVNSFVVWGSGMGVVGLVGVGLYVLMIDWLGMFVKNSLLVSVLMFGVMLLFFFVIFFRERIKQQIGIIGYELFFGFDRDDLLESECEIDVFVVLVVFFFEFGLLFIIVYYNNYFGDKFVLFWVNFCCVKLFFWFYMFLLLFVYVVEYIIN